MIRNTTITNCRQTLGTLRKSHTTIKKLQEDKAKQPALPHQDDCKISNGHKVTHNKTQSKTTISHNGNNNESTTTKLRLITDSSLSYKGD